MVGNASIGCELTFFNGQLWDEVHVKQPPYFKIKGQEESVCKLRKTLYGFVWIETDT